MIACVCKVALAALLCFSSSAFATERPLTADCLVKAASAYSIHPDVLLAVLMVEGGSVGENSRPNKNGSYDIGLFQLNSIHRDAIAQLGITEDLLRNDGCVNATVAAWHLRKVFPPEKEAQITTDADYLSAIAVYHSATPEFNAIYARKLRAVFERMYSQESIE